MAAAILSFCVAAHLVGWTSAWTAMPVRMCASRRSLRPRASPSLGAKKQKAHFEAYLIEDRDLAAGIFPPPDRRDAVRTHKKHMPEGAPVSKAPDDWASRWMPGLDLTRKGLRLLHLDPPVLVVDDFFSKEECEALVALTETEDAFEVESATFSTLTASARTSTTWYTRHTVVPTFVGRAAELTGRDPNTFEEPQIVRYKTGQRFTWHYDEVPAVHLANGGQRRATLLVYLNDVSAGGGTAFRDLGVTVTPKQGRALLFFPSDVDGVPDDRTLHAGEAPREGLKYIAQMWLHERDYVPGVVPGAAAGAAAEAFAAYRAASGVIGAPAALAAAV
jgi:prolyl 4-hydroxylase